MNDENTTITDLVVDWFGWILLSSTIFTVILLVSAILVARKAGYSHWLGVIAVMVPVIGPLLFLVFAIIKWPALQERDHAIATLEAKGIKLEPMDRPKAEIDLGGKKPADKGDE